jgi:SAM-dependent methyltransferase
MDGAQELRRVACDLCSADDPHLLFTKDDRSVVRCGRCGLAYVSPRPGPEGLTGLYRDASYYRNANACPYGYGDYLADRPLLEHAAAARVAGIERRRPARGRLLDIGCATGVLLETASARGWSVCGVEVSDFAARVCRERGLSVHHGDLASAGLAAGSFDVAVCDDTIEHLPSPRAALVELHRVLAPGGLLVLQTPNEQGLLRRLMGPHWFHFKPLEHLYYFAPDTLGRLLAGAGFRVLDVGATSRPVSVRYLLGRLRTYHARGAARLDRVLARASLASRPFWLPVGELVLYAERV